MYQHIPAGGEHGPDPVPPPDRRPVEVLHWPEQADRRASLVADGAPRLLILDIDAAPPLVWDDLEDWIRASAGRVEVEARSARLEERAAVVTGAVMPLPLLDGDGTLRAADGRRVHLSPLDTRLVHRLLECCDHVVRRDDLRATVWPTGGVTDRALDARICRLRSRLASVGLQITTVRGRGYLLERRTPTWTT